jgi:1-acyl-sn-glycerol-3-phosphate acyltransferase
MNFYYFLGYLLSSIPVVLINHLEAVQKQRIPKTGGFILASNHASHLDPPTLGVSIYPRELHYMGRSTLFKPAWWGWMLRQVNTHPIVRGQGPDQDWDSFINVIKAGSALLIFPEGTRTETGELQRGKSGFGRLVHMSQAPVYPAYIQGSHQSWPKGGKFKPSRLRVIFGEAVPLDDLLSQPGEKHNIRAISDRVMQAIARLKEEIDKK